MNNMGQHKKLFTQVVSILSLSLCGVSPALSASFSPSSSTSKIKRQGLHELLEKKKAEQHRLIHAMDLPENKSNTHLGKRLRELLLEIADIEKALAKTP